MRGYLYLCLAASLASFASSFPSSARKRRQSTTLLQGTWKDLEASVMPPVSTDSVPTSYPVSIDSAVNPETPTFSDTKPTLYRERHGWCPYSERVWLTLEIGGVDYDTIRIDNTGHGPRPSYYSGQTPQMRWPEGKAQGESMDLVYELDRRYDLGLKSDDDYALSCVNEFRNIMPRARPSSRAAFLFQNNGEPLPRSTFEETLQQVNDLLGQTDGNYFCGEELSVADIAWVPFLERFRFQLPCLHDGLWPDDVFSYQHLSDWYAAMEFNPAYACRVSGDASSWRKVLSMAGFGNAGAPPAVEANMENFLKTEDRFAREAVRNKMLWSRYREGRDYLADTPSKQVALTILRNRKALVADATKRAARGSEHLSSLQDEGSIDAALLELAECFMDDDIDGDDGGDGLGFVNKLSSDAAAEMARFLDGRICVPRDMGAIPAAYLKLLANKDKEL